jgi:acyl-CoA dehydrogenase
VVNSQAQAVAALAVDYVKDRAVFGKSLSSFQNTKFVLAECQSHVVAGQAVVDQAMENHERGELTPAEAAAVKLFCSEMQGRVVDACRSCTVATGTSAITTSAASTRTRA